MTEALQYEGIRFTLHRGWPVADCLNEAGTGSVGNGALLGLRSSGQPKGGSSLRIELAQGGYADFIVANENAFVPGQDVYVLRGESEGDVADLALLDVHGKALWFAHPAKALSYRTENRMIRLMKITCFWQVLSTVIFGPIGGALLLIYFIAAAIDLFTARRIGEVARRFVHTRLPERAQAI